MRPPWWRRRRGQHVDGEAAARARQDAQKRLRQTRRRWPEVEQAHDQLAAWVEQALKGRRA